MERTYRKQVVLPALVKMAGRYKYPYHAVIMLICEIPAGQIATEKALMECLAAAYGKSGLEIERCLTAVKDTQKAKLEAEGHTILQPVPDKDSYLVETVLYW